MAESKCIVSDKADCSGCGACAQVCPRQCIVMAEDEEGFLYPNIRRVECLNCNKCKQVCPNQKDVFISSQDTQVLVGKHKSEQVVYDSSSGGAFSSLYTLALKNSYIVYGAKWKSNKSVEMVSADNEMQCSYFRKSKYIQASYNRTYISVGENLSAGKKVLYSGTPCQCAGLLCYLSINGIGLENLLTVSVLCHGISNSKVLGEYINWIEYKYHKCVEKLSFKSKHRHWGTNNTRSMEIHFVDGETKYRIVENDPFLLAYYRELIYRPSCGKCKYARKERVSDITIGDAWGIHSISNKFNPHVGASLIILASDKARDFFSKINDMDLETVSSEWAYSSQGVFIKPTSMHTKRTIFFEKLGIDTFDKAVYSCVKHRIGSYPIYIAKQRIKQLISIRNTYYSKHHRNCAGNKGTFQ